MHIFSLVINTLGFCLGTMACFILVFVNKSRTLPNLLLLILVTGFTLSALQGVLINTGYIIHVPHLFRVSSPLFYLMIPAGYLYLRVSIKGEQRFGKADSVHLIPAVLHFLELIPWYLKDSTYKIEWLSKSLSDPDFVIQLREGLLSPYSHNVIRATLAFCYVAATIFLWRSTPLAKQKFCHAMSSASFWRPGTLLSLVSFLIIYIAAILILPVHDIGRTNLIGIMTGVTFVVTNLILFSKPELLYGLFPGKGHHEVYGGKSAISKPSGVIINDEDIREDPEENRINLAGGQNIKLYQARLEEVLKTKPYLKQGYSLNDLSKDTDIPRHHLSGMINKVYGVRFNDFINRYRINHISENLMDAGWQNLTIEAIANDAGFNSRTTFFYAIKKFTGLGPKEFLEKLKGSNIELINPRHLHVENDVGQN